MKPSGRVLQLARRELPRGLMCRVLLGGQIVVFGWVFAAVGMMFVLIFLPTLDLSRPFSRPYRR